MSQLTIIEQNDQRVLTTQQLAEVYGSDTERIVKNFNRNKERYTNGKHFIFLEGDSLKEFRAKGQIDLSPNINRLYLWTEKGAWLHAKSLNTDEAWDAYEMLVDDYYHQKQSQIDVQQLSPELQMFKTIFDTVAQKQIEDTKRDEKLQKLENGMNTIKETFTKKDDDWRKSVNSMLNSAAKRTGGNYKDLRVESYSILEERAKCNLTIRVNNLKQRLEETGATKTKINNTTKMDVIEQDQRLKEIYTTIVKELSIGTLI
ncbi:ORF6N domain-containing protein [Alkalihalobacterium alkalinitrilicum]|uniref:ORF6N domain-containing protein n=1 Tax=Alkalihalobacterium alkalinitrilicum TaxID=427920 RepID=UPI000994B3C2|nr:ORF6N domain-containing protein [Alkalihalobacterium alkalinitrilicum]